MSHRRVNLWSELTGLSDQLFLAFVVLIGLIPRFINIAKASIWHDEGYTMMLAPQSPGQIIARTARDVHPPLYYLSLHYWIHFFGTSELAARGFSAILMIGTIIVGFYLAKEIFGYQVARISAIFLALGPFLVRYSQEARMYGMEAFLATLATYLLVRAHKSNRLGFWVGYSLSIAAALYTHYYAVFVIALHWLYMLIIRKPKWGITNKFWWASNVLSALIFAPWLPSAAHQFSRVQAAFWIPKPTALTLPSTLGQFLTFTDLGALGNLVRLVGLAALALAIVWLMARKDYFPGSWLIVGLTFLGPLLVLALSLKRPIYVDRYFVFAAVGFYILVAALIGLIKNRRLAALAGSGVVAIFLIGIGNVYSQATHNMRAIGRYVDARFQPGDEIISGELYTYFDYSYYNHTGTVAKLLDPGGMSGYGETSLLYDRADQIGLSHFSDAKPASGRVWVIGKPGAASDFDVPASWQLLDDYKAADSEVRRYQIGS